VVSQLAEYGEVVSAAPILTPSTLNWTLATPEPPSAELDDTLIVPFRLALAAGELTEPDGAVLSTLTLVIVPEVKLLPELSVVTTLKS